MPVWRVEKVFGHMCREDVLEKNFVHRAHRLHALALGVELLPPHVVEFGGVLSLQEDHVLVEADAIIRVHFSFSTVQNGFLLKLNG